MTNMDTEDYDDDEDGVARPIVRHVVQDLKTAHKMRKATVRQQTRTARLEIRADSARRKDELRAEIARMRGMMTAREAASKHVATYSGAYMTLLVLSFLGAVKYLDESSVAVVAGLITLCVTSITSLLRAVVSENGHSDEEQKPPKKKG